ncbi:MAG TPA: tetratricopeptide repeat protein [Roseiarcus sp.]|nr:tetratricopeptide repeat protein [Roseiarcus sp.]
MAKQGRDDARPTSGGASPAPNDASALFVAAASRHQAGRLAEAEGLYRQTLARDPNHAGAYHFLGVLAHQTGRGEAAVALIAKALSLKADDPAIHSNLGNVLRAQGKTDEAIACYRLALKLSPNFADEHGNLGNAFKDQDRLEEAVASYLMALAIKPDFIEAHNNLGNAYKEQGQYDKAIASYRKALALKPSFADAHSNLGAALMLRGDLDGAVESYRRALDLKPDFPDALNNLGVALRDRGKLGEAKEAYQRALGVDPGFVLAHYNLANALREEGRLDEAIAAYRCALALRPDLVEAHNNLGNALKDQGKLAAAADAYRQAVALRPDFADAHNNLGNALRDQGNLSEAARSYERALALKPDFAEALNNRANILKDQGRLDEALALYKHALELEPDAAATHSNLLLSQHYLPRRSNAELFSAAREFDERFGQSAPKRAFSIVSSDERRLRIGYVSADFRTHPVGYFLARVLEAHDRHAFEIFCYANHVKSDAMTQRLATAAEHWRGISGAADVDAAAMIAGDAIDILVDLSGHTAGNRLPLFALRPAPVQVSWLGYFGTTGLGAMDYILMDRWAAPAGCESWYSETVLRLPYGRFCYAPPDYAPPVADPPALSTGYVAFGSFNNISKISDATIELWRDVLCAAPQSRLIVKWKALDDEETRRRLANAFAAAGVQKERLEFRGFSPHAEMLAEYADIDIALDPFPFGGGLTSCEALWMGVPVVTLPGDRPASRQTIAFLNLLGLSECVATTPADYAARAAALAADPARLREIRRSLRARMAMSPLCDGPLFTRNLEAAFRQMWQASLDRRRPAPVQAAAAS